jgi:hypothetical protein
MRGPLPIGLEVSLLDLQLWYVALGVIVVLFLGAFIGGRIGILVRLTRRNERTRMEERREALREVEEAIIEESPEEWTEIHLHLLQSLEDKAAPEAYARALRTIRDAIDRRMESGVWQAGELRFPDRNGEYGGVTRNEQP